MSKKNTISLDTAMKWTKKWRKKESKYNKHHECKAFNIPKTDLQEVLAEEGVASIRAYLGVDDNNVEKLMIVGVDKNGKDMITSTSNSTLKSATIQNDGGIWDFTEPCPVSCDETSPLNG